MFGTPRQLRQDCLPTKRDIYDHYLYLRKVKIENREWKQNIPLSDAASEVYSDIKKQWDKTEIPHRLQGRKGEKDVSSLLMRIQKIIRTPSERRDSGLGQELDSLFDMAHCPHTGFYPCSCPEDKQV